jgi:predicted acyl esterase
VKRIPSPYTLPDPHSPPPYYDRQPAYDKIKDERDIMVPMRDGVHVCVDIFRPDAEEKFPALLSFCKHNKDLQTPEACELFGPQPAWSALWFGAHESGDSRFLVGRGYAHVIGNLRGVGKSEDGPPSQWDAYDLIEWIAQQPWCDGNIGMIGISSFAIEHWQAAIQQPPHLKAIFPYDAMSAYMFRDGSPGGVLHTFMYLVGLPDIGHVNRGRPEVLPPEQESRWQEAMNNSDYRMYSQLYNILTQKGQHTPAVFNQLLNPYASEEADKLTESNFKKVKVPVYTGAGWYDYSYKINLQGCQHWYAGIEVPKKLIFTGPSHLERPWHSFHNEVLRWYDYWLKGIDTGIMDEPPVKVWVMGANQWYHADDWPAPETRWTKFYLHSWERLREAPFIPSSRDDDAEPDAFVQMPPTKTRAIQKLRYLTDPLPEDTLIAGPSVLNLYASLDQEDTNWIAILKDVGPDVSVRTAREGENFILSDLPERELVRGWLKASHRALDPKRSKPWKPWHPLTRETQKPVVPGEIAEYAIEILPTANLFKSGHRICIEITSLDMPTGTAGLTNIEYFPYHVCSSKTTLHKIYHSEKYPSHLLLPVIPDDSINP